MSKRLITFFSVLFIFCSSVVLSQDENMGGDASMQVWMDYMTPGPEHEAMAKSVGEWKTSTKFWMAPGTEPQLSEGTSVDEMILGGRYLKSTYHAPVMGMEMEGINLVGFDNASEEYTSVWIDNMGTGVMIAKGKWNEEANALVLTGKMMDPMSKEYLDFKEVVKFIDDNNQLMEMFYTLPDGSEFKSMEVTYTR